MDLQQEWQKMSSEIVSKETLPLLSENNKQQKSNHLLDDLKFKLKWKLRWIRIIDIPILLFALLTKGDLQLVLIGFFLSYEICRWLMIGQLNKFKAVVDYSLNTKQVLEETLASLTQILKVENIFGYIFLPITGPIGLMAAKLYHHQTFENVFNLPNVYLQLAISILVSIPILLLAKKANNYLFEARIKELKSKILILSE